MEIHTVGFLCVLTSLPHSRTHSNGMVTKAQLASNRASSKEDTGKDNYRNRLFRLFGNRINKKDGTLPSAIKGLVELTVRLWNVLRHGSDVSQEGRPRVITVGVDKVILSGELVPGRKGTPLTGHEIQTRFQDLSNYVAQVKVLASLLANFICLEKLHADSPLPHLNTQFYEGCLTVCRSAKGGSPETRQAFERFCTASGNQALQKESGVNALFNRQVSSTMVLVCSQCCEYCESDISTFSLWYHNQAIMMATNTGTFMEHQFTPRLQTLLKWALRQRLWQHRQAGISQKTFAYRIHQLSKTLTDFDGNQADLQRILADKVSNSFLMYYDIKC